MSKPIRKFTGTITVTGSTGVLNTVDDPQFGPLQLPGGELRQIMVKAPAGTRDVDFSVKITDPDSFDPFEKKGNRDKMNSQPNIFVFGNHVITIFDASRAGDYTYKMLMEEKW